MAFQRKKKTPNEQPEKNIFTGKDYAVYCNNNAHGDDAWLSRKIKDGIMYGVFDGLSRENGKLASSYTAAKLKTGKIANIDDVVRLLEVAHNHLWKKDAATTATIAITIKDQLYIVDSGDSPAYLIRDKKTIQLTETHRVPGRPAALCYYIGGSVSSAVFFVHKTQKQLQPEDKLVLITDGIDDNIYPQELTGIVNSSNSPREAVEGVIQLLDAKRKKNKGRDDVWKFFKPDDMTMMIRYFA